MKYILIVICVSTIHLNGQIPPAYVAMQEFNSRQHCLDAAEIFDNTSSGWTAVCREK